MSFKLGTKTAQELGIVMLRSSQRPILPSTVDRTLPIPGRAGQRDFGADLSYRQFDLECAINTKDPYELQQRVMELAAHLVDSYGRPKELELRFDIRPDQFFRVRYSGNAPIDRVAGLGTFTLPLVGFDPFAYADQEHIFETTIKESPFIIEVFSDGNVRTQPVIVLTNQGENTIKHFKITNEYRLE